MANVRFITPPDHVLQVMQARAEHQIKELLVEVMSGDKGDDIKMLARMLIEAWTEGVNSVEKK